MTSTAISAWLRAEGEPAYRAEQILRWVYARGLVSFDEMTNLPHGLRTRLAAAFSIPHLSPAQVVQAGDGTRKLLFCLADGCIIESVVIPDLSRITVCVSSQAGCAMGCHFCATARLGLLRHLSADEIVAQVLAARQTVKGEGRLTNIVFMGMGEPLHNYGAVVEAIGVLTASWGIGISPRRITVSTVGLVPGMQRLMKETTVNLAVSLNATTDDLRSRLAPVNRRHPLEELLDTCRRLPLPQRRRITFEYVLLKGVNDSQEDAGRLIRLLHGIRCKVNLIPFNPFPGAAYERPDEAGVNRFRDRLDAARVHASIRTSRGIEVAAACGQLAGAAASSPTQ